MDIIIAVSEEDSYACDVSIKTSSQRLNTDQSSSPSFNTAACAQSSFLVQQIKIPLPSYSCCDSFWSFEKI